MKKRKKSMLVRNLRRTVTGSMGRFIAIVAIIALGAGLFAGLMLTKTDMVYTTTRYLKRQQMFDLRLLSSYGWSEDAVEQIAAAPGIEAAEGSRSVDVLLHKQNDENTAAYKLISLPETLNQVTVQSGRLPRNVSECVIDGTHTPTSILGTTVTVSDTNEAATLEMLNQREFTVVGLVRSPLYMNTERGNTTIGSGKLAGFLYILPEAFATDYYTDIYACIPGDYALYTDDYDDAMEQAGDALDPLLQELARERMEKLHQDGEEAYADGLAEYEKGLEDYRKARTETYDTLNEALRQIQEGKQELEENRAKLEDGKIQLEDARKTLQEQRDTLLQGKETLAQAKIDTYAQLTDANKVLLESYNQVQDALSQVNSGLSQLETGLVQLNSGITQLESGLAQLDAGLSQLDTLLSVLDPAIEAAQKALDYAKEQNFSEEALAEAETKLNELIAKRDDYAAQRDTLTADRETYAAQLEDLYAQREPLETQKADLLATQSQLNDAMVQIDQGFTQLQSQQLQADSSFASAQAELDRGEAMLAQGETELNKQEKTLSDGLAALEQGERELEQAQADYDKGLAEAKEKLGEASQTLQDAKKELEDAREKLDTMEAPSVYALTRNTNVGYVSMESDSDIVAGVSRVFPVFFLLVAALVCITTMTRMVSEERTQIGTFKALGYSDAQIAGKYLGYAAIGALGGCGLGVLVGSVVFPQIIWQAYKMLYNIQPFVDMTLDVPLCIAVVVAYTLLALASTWYCCHKTLTQVPAELIRPAPPTSGKKLLLEKMPLWNKISFLNKVSLRNIFRYRQRLAMMLLGIGGCTALLVTGFGIRDTISNIVDYQFAEVTLYDVSASFRENLSPAQQEQIVQALSGTVDEIRFVRQTTAELEADSRVKEVYLLSTDQSLDGFVDLHHGKTHLSMPGTGEAVISAGAAESMDLHIGDTITLRNADMQAIGLTVSGIFDNHVYNYVLTSHATIRLGWGEDNGFQTALITTRPEQDPHLVSAKLMGMDNVLSVTVNQDIAQQVGSMMKAMDLIVITVVICAALLAIIVLYNLTNINIKEREREIATIKVLGFRAGESAAYVFKENLALSLMGAVLGLFPGKLLLTFVVSQIKLDLVWFQPRVAVISYIVSFVLTMVSACVVDFIFYFRLEKINMAEALKSVE